MIRRLQEFPLLFQPSMSRALLDGRKTVTRRLIKLPASRGEWEGTTVFGLDAKGIEFPETAAIWNKTTGKTIASPYGTKGDKIWVRETFSWLADGMNADHDHGRYVFAADGKIGGLKYKPSIHMPRIVCRTMLTNMGVTVERLQDITEKQALAEGIRAISKDYGRTWKYGIADADGEPGTDNFGWPWHEWCDSARDAFKKLICSINGSSAWDENPFVWVINFERIKDGDI